MSMAIILYKQLKFIQIRQTESNQENLKTNQFILSTIDWSTERQKKILYMRDIIIDEWKRIGLKKIDYNKAYLKSESIIKECEKYSRVDPFAMLAVQRVESCFLDSLESVMHAKGSWQFVQSTAILLCQAIGITYSEKMLNDPVLSTKLAGKYFDVLYASYPDSVELARFADYNGGPRQALYYLYDKTKLSNETKSFIVTVQEYKEKYTKKFIEYKPQQTLKK
jgi:hypothetical protein